MVQQRPTVPICFTLPSCALRCVNVDIFFKQKMWHFHCKPTECSVYFEMTGLKEGSIYSRVQTHLKALVSPVQCYHNYNLSS